LKGEYNKKKVKENKDERKRVEESEEGEWKAECEGGSENKSVGKNERT
jgi:hypothetical protein